MIEYTRKDEIFYGDDPGLENAIGKKVYASNDPTFLLTLANYGNPDLWCETLAVVNKDADSRPFSTYEEVFGYKHYDALIIKKDDDD